ncbi:MAG: hypothetical protein ACRD2Z_14390 [Thermoanaerobaculia bacterium]
MNQETEELARQLQEGIQGLLHKGLEAHAEASPAGDIVRVDVVGTAEDGTPKRWRGHVFVADLEKGDDALPNMAKLLAERASRAWLVHQADGVEN